MAKNNLKKGKLITFEGPEGSGKSTQMRLLSNYLRGKGFKVLQLREPGGTAIGEQIRRILLNPANKDMNVLGEMLLYQAARAQLVREKILPALKQKKIVVLDRFLDATICYQGYGSGIKIELIKQVGKLATCGIVPNLTILLDIAAAQGLRRVKRRDRIEQRSLAFHRRVRKGYLKLARQDRRRIKIVPVRGKIIETQRMIRKIVNRTLALRDSSRPYS